MKTYLCPRCHIDHGPEPICGHEALYCPKCITEMGGYTLKDIHEAGLKSGIAAYMPYIPFYSTPLPVEDDFSI